MKKSKEILALSTVVALSTVSPTDSGATNLINEDLNKNHSKTRVYSKREEDKSKKPHAHFLSQYDLNFEKELETRSNAEITNVAPSNLLSKEKNLMKVKSKIPFGLRYTEKSHNNEEEGFTVTWKDVDCDTQWTIDG